MAGECSDDSEPSALHHLGEALAFGGVSSLFGIVAIAFLLFNPLPTYLLDILVVGGIVVGVASIIMATSLRVSDYSNNLMPALLVILALSKMALSLSAMQLILHEGKLFDGQVIKALGAFVLGGANNVTGDFVIGVIVFGILVYVHYVVCTEGCEYLTEVEARFTLDVIPGKQMAIDADLNAGVIEECVAWERREEISNDSDFFGAMAAASRLIKIDMVVANIILVAIVGGGLAISFYSGGAGFVEGTLFYTLFAVGNGVVSIALSLSIAFAAIIWMKRR